MSVENAVINKCPVLLKYLCVNSYYYAYCVFLKFYCLILRDNLFQFITSFSQLLCVCRCLGMSIHLSIYTPRLLDYNTSALPLSYRSRCRQLGREFSIYIEMVMPVKYTGILVIIFGIYTRCQ